MKGHFSRCLEQITRSHHILTNNARRRSELSQTVVLLEIRKCKRSIFSFLESLLPEFGPCRLPSLKNITLYFTMREESRLTRALLDDWKKRSNERASTLNRSMYREGIYLPICCVRGGDKTVQRSHILQLREEKEVRLCSRT